MRATDRLSEAEFAPIRRRAIFECCKWDPQAEDVSVLADYALVLDVAQWRQLASLAEQLDAEVLGAESELAARPKLVRMLGLPRVISRLFDRHGRCAVAGPRVMRFDFHWTADGWRISEANTDVPGGFIEGGGFTALMASSMQRPQAAADPVEAYVDAIVAALGQRRTVALVHATAYTDDRQVMIYLARKLAARGCQPLLASPANLSWIGGRAHAHTGAGCLPVDLIVRFFPAEWLPNLPRACLWRHFFRDSTTPQSNPAWALLSQSKRLPLVWDALAVPMPAWRSLLPETRDPRAAAWQRDEGWVLKSALGRVGDGVALRGVTPQKSWLAMARSARWFPGQWVAQRRFEAIALETPDGLRYPALGVFTIAGRAGGIYARLARRPLIDHAAQDAAVLLESVHEKPLAHAGQVHELRALV